MGNFFTSIQIHNPEQLSKEQFIELFCNKMKENGFVVGNAEDHEISYVLAFADNCKWVSVSSETYEQGNAATQKDAGNIAKMLNACCINIIVVDSDFAMLDMYSNKGKKLDTAVMGRADDYLGDDIPAPKKNAWSAILSEGSTWERFAEVQQGDYVFVEDGLSELAPLLGMNSRNILFDAEDANEFDENTCFLYFKKANAKKPKKLTLNAAFKQVFGEALEPLGFVKIKSKHPYYVRVVNDEILHIITFDKDYPGKFSVFGGIATVYRKKIDFDQDVLYNLVTLNDTAQFYAYSFKDYSKDDTVFRERSYSYLPNDNDSIEQTFIKAFDQAKQYILPVLDNIVSLRDCIDHYMVYHSPIINIISDEYDRECRNEGLLYFKIDDHSDMIQEFNKSNISYKKRNKNKRNFDSEFKRYCDSGEEYRMELISKRDAIYNDPVVYQQVMEELERRRQANIEKLKSYGLFLEKANTQKPKKLTLNAAFKQVFGEALEPLGFVKIKSKHPYFVRVVNGEILHIITFKKESFCKNAFNVFAGIATVYRKEIDFDQDVGFNLNWMNSIQQFCSFVFSNSTDTHKTDDVYMFEPNNNQSIIRALSDSLEQFQINSLPTLDKICNLRTVIDFYLIYCSSLIFLYPIEEFFNNSDKNNENLLYFKIDDHSDMTLEFNKHIKIQRELRKNRKDFEADFKSFCNRAENYRINQIDKRDAIYNDPVVYQQVMEELERRRQANIEKLKSYGLFLEKANAKKPKKLTLNAAFKQVFGESLEPLGFVKIKSKHPYFVRVVNGEILHIITYRTEQPQYPEDRAFNILGGVATVYRKKIDLSVGIKNNYNWLRSSVDDFYAISLGDDHDRYYRQTISCFYYFSEIEKSMLSALNDSLELVKKYMLPVLNGVDTLEKSIEFFEKFMLLIDTSAYNTDLCFDGDSDYNEGFLYIKTDYQKLKEKWRRIVEGENKILPETLKRVTELYKFFVDPVFNKAVLDELEKRKKSNIENLKLYGVNIN